MQAPPWFSSPGKETYNIQEVTAVFPGEHERLWQMASQLIYKEPSVWVRSNTVGRRFLGVVTKTTLVYRVSYCCYNMHFTPYLMRLNIFCHFTRHLLFFRYCPLWLLSIYKFFFFILIDLHLLKHLDSHLLSISFLNFFPQFLVFLLILWLLKNILF